MSNPTRSRVDSVRSADLVRGQWYVGFDCHDCRRKFAVEVLASNPGAAMAQSARKGNVTIQCPHCSSEDEYQWTEHIRFSAT